MSILKLNGKEDRPVSELAGDWDSARIPPHPHSLTATQHPNFWNAQPFPDPFLTLSTEEQQESEGA